MIGTKVLQRKALRLALEDLLARPFIISAGQPRRERLVAVHTIFNALVPTGLRAIVAKNIRIRVVHLVDRQCASPFEPRRKVLPVVPAAAKNKK